MKRIILPLILLFGAFLSDQAIAQVVGDYRTQQDGGWATLATWQRLNSVGPEVWATPTVGQGHPGQNAVPGTVTIRNTHDVILDTSPANSLGTLVLGGGTSGTLTVGINTNTSFILTVSGAVSIAAGAQLLSRTDTDGSHTFNFQNTLTNDGTINFAAGTETVTMTVSATTTNNGTLSFGIDTGVKTFVGPVVNTGSWTSTTMTTAGNLIFRQGVSSSTGTFAAGGATFNDVTTNTQTIGGSGAMSFTTVVLTDGSTGGAMSVTNSSSNTVTISSTAAAALTGTAGASWIQGSNTTLSYAGSTMTTLTLNGATNTPNTINYTGASPTIFPASYNNLTFSGSTTATIATGTSVNVSGDLTVSTGTLTAAGTGTLVLNGTTAAQTLSGAGTFTLGNVTLSGAGSFPVNVNRSFSTFGTIDFSAATTRSFVVNSSSNITVLSTGSISNGDANSYFELDGATGTNSSLIRQTGNNNTNWDFLFPIGTSLSGYTPIDLQTIGGVNPTNGSTLTVKSILNADIAGRLRRSFRLTVAGNSNATTFSTGVFGYNFTTDKSGTDTEASYTAVFRLNSNAWTNIATIAAPTNQFTVDGGTVSTASLATGTYEYTIGENPTIWYTYQSGNYNNPDVWTLDPSGTTLDNPFNTIPGIYDEITILNGFTVTLNVSSILLNSTTIEAGGTLDMAATTGHDLGTITGTGTLRVNGTVLPSGTYTAFVATTGGTVEYYNTSGNLSTTQTTYNKLKLTNSTGANIIFTLVSNLTVNGTFDLSTTGAGTVGWQINDVSNTQRTIVLYGDLTVSSGGRISVGGSNADNTSGNENTTTPHNLTMYGNIVNNGIIRFFYEDTELALADYGLTYPAAGIDLHRNELQGNAVTVTFAGTASKTVTCNNTTDFYRLVLNKGTGQQAVLTINSANTAYFRLFGPADIATTEAGNSWEYTSANAISLVNGTLELTGSINIPVLQIDQSTTGYFPIPRNSGLWLNGTNVTVQISDLTPAAYGDDKDGRILMSGLLRISAGTLFDGFSKGLGSQDGGAYLQEGGTVTCWQFRPRVGGSQIFSFTQTGGTMNVGYGYALSGGKIDTYEEDYMRFDLRSTASTFQMSGTAVLNIAKPTNTNNGDGGLLYLGSTAGNYNVTGGTVNLYTGNETASTSYAAYINSTVPLYNLTINEESTTAENAQLQTNSLVVLNNLTLNTGNDPSFVTNSFNVTVGGNFAINASTTYTPGTGITTLNGSGAQTWTHNGTITALASVVMNKASGTLTLAGSNTFPNITTALTLTSGTLNDGGKTITVSGTGVLSNSATHTGSGSIDYTSSSSTIAGSNGTFGNLTITRNATIATAGNQTVTGTLRLIGANSTLNIGSNALTVAGNIFSDASPGTAVAFTSSKRIQTTGLHNAGGLTRTAIANTALLFPVGSGSLYTPNAITVNNATAYGTITVRPVAAEHPNVTTTGTSVLYYWRVTSSGFVTTGSTTVSHSNYSFSTATKNGTAADYRAARYDRAANTWAAYGTNTAMTTSILPSPFNTGDAVAGHWPAGLGDLIDGEYTCGNIGAFGTVTAYYSKGDGAWNALTGVWTSSSTHSGADLAGPPCSTCPVIIGDGAGINHIITIDQNSRSCGTLGLNTGSTLNCGGFTDLNFGTTAGGAVTGGGTLRIGSPNFPSGDFTNFIGSAGGTVEWYHSGASSLGLTGTLGASSTNLFVAAAGTYTDIPQASSSGSGTGARFTIVIGALSSITSVTVTQAGANYASGNTVTINGSALGGTGTMTRAIAAGNISYVVPATGPSPQNLTLATYYNVIFNPVNGFTINLPPSNLTVYNNWTQQTGTGTVTNNGARSLTINGGLTISSASPGLLSLTNSGNTTLSVAGNTSISSTGTFSATSGTHTFTTTGGITNNGTFNCNGGGTIALTFTGTSDMNFTGTGSGGTTLSTVTLNKGTSQTPRLLFDVGGTVTAATSGWLTLSNGTFEFNNAGPHVIVSTATTYTIPSTTKLKVSSGTVSILNNASATADLLLNGTLEVGGGTVNVAGGTSGNDIEYASAGTPSIVVSGGALNVNGSIRRSTTNITGALVYNQSGGTVTVGGRSSNNTRGVFEIDYNTGSSFTLTGTSSLIVERQTGGTSYADLYINPIASNVASTSTITIGNTAGTNTNFRINIAPSVGTLTILGTSAQTVNMFSNALVLKGSLNINSPSSLTTNSLDVTVAGDMTIAGTGIYTGGTNTTTFNGTAAQAAALTTGSTFNNLKVNKTAGTILTLSGAAPTLNNLNILSGVLNVGSLDLQVSADITNNSSQIGAGTVTIAGAASTHNITSSNGVFANLTLGGSASTIKVVNLTGNLTINGALNFSVANKYFMIKSSQLTFGNASSITGSGSTSFIRTNGVVGDLGVTKIFPVGTTSFTYGIGNIYSYAPVVYSLNTTVEGSLNVTPINSRHLTAVGSEQILNYYWIVTRGSTLAATASASHTYSYPSSLLGGSGGTLTGGYLDISNPTGWVTSGHGGSATSTQMTFTTTPTTNFPVAGNTYHYAAGTSGVTGSLPNPIVPVYSRFDDAGVSNPAAGGNWNSASSWTLESDGTGVAVASAPSGVAVVILPGARINANLNGRKAFVTTNNGLLDVGTSVGHNLGTISGTGTLRIGTNTFPAGNYASFVSSAGGTIEYVAPMIMNNRTTYNNLSIYSGTAGTVTMTASNLTINGNVTIPATTTLSNTTNNANMSIAGNWINNGTFDAGSGTVTFNGAGAQSTTGSTTFCGVTVNKTNNLTIGASPITINCLLTLTAGNLISSSNPAAPTLILGSAATTSGGSATSFVSGQIRKTMNNASTFIYPTGSNSASRYRPVTITNTSATDVWDIIYVPNNPTADGYPNATFNTANMAEVSEHEYWLVSNATGTTSAGMTLAFGPGSYASGGDAGTLSSLKLVRWTGTEWDIAPGGGTFSQTGTSAAGTVSVSVQSSFSPQTFGTDDLNSALPIELEYFNAEIVDDQVVLKWKTASELDNDFFTVERTVTGETFESIGQVNGKGTTNTAHYYTLVDPNPVVGTSYYRLKQTDFDETSTYSRLVVVQYEGPEFPFLNVYPNPAKEQEVTLMLKGFKGGGSVPVSIFDQLGRERMSFIMDVDSNTGTISRTLNFKDELPFGVYVVKAGLTKRLVKRFVVAEK